MFEATATTPVPAHMKVINPLLSTGPAATVQVVECSDSEVTFRAQRRVFTGALVQLRIGGRFIVGDVMNCSPIDAEHQVRMRVREIL